jgi:pimeloyl-ACP methyl ester carboxylesterase
MVTGEPSGGADGDRISRGARHDAVATTVEVFHVESGDRDNAAVVLVHGFRTCNIDWSEVVELLRDRFLVCALDSPGYGLSDKPRGWGYSLDRDAELLDHYVREVLGLGSVVLMAHDRGSSVTLNYVLSEPEPGPHGARRLRRAIGGVMRRCDSGRQGASSAMGEWLVENGTTETRVQWRSCLNGAAFGDRQCQWATRPTGELKGPDSPASGLMIVSHR